MPGDIYISPLRAQSRSDQVDSFTESCPEGGAAPAGWMMALAAVLVFNGGVRGP